MVRLFAVLSVAAVFCGVARADHPVIIRQEEVRTDGLNLAREADAKIFLARLETAASRACGGRPFTINMHPAAEQMRLNYFTCRNTALAEAVAALRSPLVSRLYAARSQSENSQIAHR